MESGFVRHASGDQDAGTAGGRKLYATGYTQRFHGGYKNQSQLQTPVNGKGAATAAGKAKAKPASKGAAKAMMKKTGSKIVGGCGPCRL